MPDTNQGKEKMKRFKFLAFMLAMIASVSFFASCSDDDDSGNGSGAGNASVSIAGTQVNVGNPVWYKEDGNNYTIMFANYNPNTLSNPNQLPNKVSLIMIHYSAEGASANELATCEKSNDQFDFSIITDCPKESMMGDMEGGKFWKKKTSRNSSGKLVIRKEGNGYSLTITDAEMVDDKSGAQAGTCNMAYSGVISKYKWI